MATANTANKTAITAKNAKAKWAGFLKTANSQRDQLQAFVIFAAEEYSKLDKNGEVCADTGWFTRILKDSVDVRSFATKTLQAYIQAHTNLAWSAPEGKEPAFRKVKGSDFKCDLDSLRSTVWYLHNDEGQAKADWKAADYAKRVLAKLEKEGLPAGEFIKLLQAAGKADLKAVA